MSRQEGVIHIFLILLVFAVLAAGLVYYIFTNTRLSQYAPASLRPFLAGEATSPKAVYQNPLDKSTQYTNPFDTNKNPFDNLK